MAKPIKRDEKGVSVNIDRVPNGSFLPCYQSRFEGFDIKRYESLRVICEDLRKSDKSLSKVEEAMLPAHHSGL